MRLKKVINLYGGPGTGKSTIAAGLFYKMKSNRHSVEYVSEYAKELTYEDRLNVLEEDQLYIFAKQHRKMFRLRNKVDYMICDSPLLLSTIYASIMTEFYNEEAFKKLIVSTNNNYPSVDIFLLRNLEYEFETKGRNQNEEESTAIDIKVRKVISELVSPTYTEMLSDKNTVNLIYKGVFNE